MQAALDNMEKAVADSCREDVQGDGETATESWRAWGVWVQGKEHRDRQTGLLGTSAGLELVSSVRSVQVDDFPHEALIVGSWEYVRDFLNQPDGDARSTLPVRQSQVLRGLSALDRHTPALSSRHLEVPLTENRQLASKVLDEMLKCRTTMALAPESQLNGLLAGERARTGPRELGAYLLTSLPAADGEGDGDPQAKPETPIEWAYLLASVLVGLSRAYLAGFLTAERFNEFVSKEDTQRLSRWSQRTLRRPKRVDEFRVGLFAGWALLQMERIFEPDDKRNLADLHIGRPSAITTSDRDEIEARLHRTDRKKLKRKLRRAAAKVVADPRLQPDLHHPYSIHIYNPGPGRKDEFRQDHLVVPTVPIALWLVARLDKRALFDPRVEDLALAVAECFETENDELPGVAPGQSSTYNGTVNMNYLHEAVGQLHDLARATADRSTNWRLRATLRRPRPTVTKAVRSPATPLYVAVVLLFAAPFLTKLYEALGII